MAKTNKLAIGAAWTLGGLLPIDHKKIVVTNFYGRGYGDNPKAIVRELLRRRSDLHIVWLVADEKAARSLPAGVRAVPYHSAARVRELCTAKVWIDNNRKGARMKKAGQWYMQTWHGFALKRIEKDAEDTLPAGYAEYAARDAEQTDLIVSNSALMTKIYRSSFWYKGPVLEFGSPRNDVFFRPDPQTREKVHRALQVPQKWHMALYAPTFRADESMEAYQLDFARLKAALEEKFGGEWAILIRLHPHVMDQADALHIDGRTTYNATRYDDMQELLSASDAVISDYSSLMFDFALTGRPCFQFATDIEEYRKDRNFYFPLEEMPFPLAIDNDALMQAVRDWDRETSQQRWKGFCRQFGIVENGEASARCADWILEKMGLNGEDRS